MNLHIVHIFPTDIEISIQLLKLLASSSLFIKPFVVVNIPIKFFSDCNGHAPLNNQRALSPQNSIKSIKTLSPNNSIKDHQSVSRQNSITSYHSNLSRNNSFTLSRQNSIQSQRTLSPQNSVGSGTPKDEYKPNNLTDVPQVKITSDVHPQDEVEDLDAMDEVMVRNIFGYFLHSCILCILLLFRNHFRVPYPVVTQSTKTRLMSSEIIS
jgi:hypothetical protein